MSIKREVEKKRNSLQFHTTPLQEKSGMMTGVLMEERRLKERPVKKKHEGGRPRLKKGKGAGASGASRFGW